MTLLCISMVRSGNCTLSCSLSDTLASQWNYFVKLSENPSKNCLKIKLLLKFHNHQLTTCLFFGEQCYPILLSWHHFKLSFGGTCSKPSQTNLFLSTGFVGPTAFSHLTHYPLAEWSTFHIHQLQKRYTQLFLFKANSDLAYDDNYHNVYGFHG